MYKTARLMLLGSCTIAMLGCNNDVHNHGANATGKELFEYHCSSCHGDSGSGKFLKGVPNNRDTELAPHHIVHKMKNGDSGMPAFPTMPDAEARKIAQYLRSIKYLESDSR